MEASPCDLFLRGADAVLTLDPGEGGAPPPVAALPGLPVHEDGAIAIGGGKILAVGPEATLRASWRPRREYDCRGGVLAPAFVDAHVHPAFAAERAEEFDWRSAGMGYQEIAARGGGIHSSVRAVRAASEEELARETACHFRRMQRHGTTSCEAKSGYGLDLASELKSLRAIRTAARETGMEVFPTFLGAHLVPLEFQERPQDYLELLCTEMLPAVWESGLARAADVFIEGGAFDPVAARVYLERARELGFALRVHAEQFQCLGGATLAVELGAECADHLEALDDHGLEALALSGRTFAGLLPAVPHFLRQHVDAPARKLLAAGVPYFVATDFNPGSCYTPSLPEAAHFARVRLGLSALEALAGVSLYAAASLGLQRRKGRIAVGCDADLVLLDLPGVASFAYSFGENPVRRVWKGGNPLGFEGDSCPPARV